MNLRVLELAARAYVFIFLNLYGVGKIIGGQFYRRGELPLEVANTTLADAAAFDLAWTFMGYSFAYILFVGVAEILGACLLIWDRTKLLGVAILLPIMTNILVFDVIFLDTNGAIASATIYTLLLLLIVYYNREQVLAAFQALTAPVTNSRLSETALPTRIKTVALAMVAMGILFAVDQFLVNWFGHGAG